MIKKLIILFSLFLTSESLINNPIIKHNKQQLNLRTTKITCINYDILSNIDKENSENIIRYITGFLPYADSIGTHVLHANENLIKIILNNNYLSEDVKKSLILNVIKMTLSGDSMGSSILTIYYDLVHHLL